MALKHILLPLSGLRDESSVCCSALALAQGLTAHVTAGFAEPEQTYYQIGMEMPTPAYGAMIEFATQLREEKRKRARQSYDAAVAATKVPIVTKPVCRQSSTEWLDGGDNDNPIAACGGLADLVIMNRPVARASAEDWLIMEEALFRAHRPALLVPQGQNAIDLSRPLIAWNGSAEACNAVLAGAHLFGEASQITVLQVGQLRPGFMPADRLIDSLGWRCLAAELRTVEDMPHKTGQTILAQAQKLGASVVVMGAYTHSRAREFLLGGVTNYALTHAQLPLLLAH
jgi:hypothetical protein